LFPRTGRNHPSQPVKPAGEGGSFAEEMALLGVEPLKSSTEEPDQEIPAIDHEPVAEQTTEAQTDEELFLQSIGAMQVRFSEHLPEEDQPVPAAPRRMKQLKRRRIFPDATLDLHGLQRAEVAGRIAFFLQDAAFQGWQTLLVITGKGLHSEAGEPVLRDEAERYLRDEAGQWVAEWGRAPREYGGAGALVLFLRRN